MIQNKSTAMRVFKPLDLPYKFLLLNFPIKVLLLLDNKTD